MAISLDSLGMLISERVNLTLAGHETGASMNQGTKLKQGSN